MEHVHKIVYKVIIAGSRNFNDYEKLKSYCDFYLKDLINTSNIELVIVSGHARGADSLGEKYAHENNYKCEVYPADWNLHGKAAGYIRNEEMAKVSNALIAFLDPNSENKGTKHMINSAAKYNLIVRVVQ